MYSTCTLYLWIAIAFTTYQITIYAILFCILIIFLFSLPLLFLTIFYLVFTINIKCLQSRIIAFISDRATAKLLIRKTVFSKHRAYAVHILSDKENTIAISSRFFFLLRTRTYYSNISLFIVVCGRSSIANRTEIQMKWSEPKRWIGTG